MDRSPGKGLLAGLPGLQARLFAPCDIASLVMFRISFGAIMLWEVWRYFDLDRIRRYYIEPDFYFTYPGFGWVGPWPGAGMYWHFAAMGILAAFITVGFLYRVSAALFFLAFTYVYLLDETRYLNHFYLVSLLSFLMIFVPAHRWRSVDARLRPAIRSESVHAWPLWLLRAQLGIVYSYAGIAKLNADWLRGQPMRTWIAERADDPIFGTLFSRPWAGWAFSYGGLLFDLSIVPMLLWRPTRATAFVLAVLFHLLNFRIFSIGIFPWLMIAATTLFLPPDWPRRLISTPAASPPAALPAVAPSGARRLITGCIAAYLVVQLLVPLRHLLYPGPVHWTEEGHQFSWRMKLRDKDASTKFIATDPVHGGSWEIDQKEYLTSAQRNEMAGRPDMILQFARHAAEQLRGEGHPTIEIRVKALVSLNGRPKQLLIDPSVDLAAQEDSLLPAPWILPLEEPLD
jgi:hypothetical protein